MNSNLESLYVKLINLVTDKASILEVLDGLESKEMTDEVKATRTALLSKRDALTAEIKLVNTQIKGLQP